MDKVTNKIDNMAVVIAAWVLRHRWLIIFLSIVTIVMLASGMRYLTISTNYRIFFSEENPELSAFEDFQSTYTKNDNILFVVKPADGKVFTPATAQAVETLTEKAWQIPYVLRVDSVSNFQHSRARGDTIEVDRLYRNGGQLSQQDLDEKEQAALAEPLLKDNLISADALSTGINVTIQYPEKSIAEVPETARHARRIRDEIAAQYPDLTIAISGIAMLNNAFGEASTTDMGTLVPLMYVFLVVVMVVALRSISACLSTLLVVILATLAAMGVAGFARIAMTPISFIAPTIIMTLAVADCIHFLVTMIDSMRKGDNKADAIAESIKVNLIPISITSLTTAIGFISLNFSDSPPFGHLGNIAGVGIVAAWVLSLTFLPALVSVLPVRVKPHRQTGMLQVQLERWAFWVCRHSRKVLLVTGGITVALALQIPKLELNDDFIRYFDRDIEFRTDTEFAIENLNGIYLVEYSVGSGSAQGIHSRRYLQPLQDFTLWLKQQPEVRHVFSYTDIIKRLNKNMHADDPAHYRLPDNNLMAAQLLFLYENSLPAGNNLSDRVNLDKSATRVTVAIDDMTSKEGIEFFRRSEQWLQDNAPREMWATPTSVSVMFSYISQRNIESMLTGNAFALIIIAVVLMIVLRSVPLGALSLIPNLAPILAMYGIWALIVGQVGMAAATVSATSLGIVVDDTVHFLAKYLRARRQLQLQPPEAIRYAFKSVGVAIVLTTVVLAMGFSVLTLSSFLINSQMGLLTSLTIVLALVLDFLLLPALLLIGYHNKEEKAHVSVYASEAA